MKIIVSIGPGIGAFGDAAKAIQVELTLKGSQFGVTEIPWQDVGDKLVLISDSKGVSLWQPGHDAIVFFA